MKFKIITVFLLDSDTNTTLSTEMTFSNFLINHQVEYTIPNSIVDQSVIVISELFVVTPVDINPSVLSIELGINNTGSTSTTSVTITTSVTQTGIDFTSSIVATSTTTQIRTIVLDSKSISSETSKSVTWTETDYRGTIIVTSTTSSITGTACRSMKQTRTTDCQSATHATSTTDTSSKSMTQAEIYYTSATIIIPSTTNSSDAPDYKHLLIYVAVGGIIIIFILVTIIIGIIWYYQRKVKAQHFMNNTVISRRNVFSLRNRSFSMRETEEKDYKQISQQQEEMREDDDTHECSDELMTNDDKMLNLI